MTILWLDFETRSPVDIKGACTKTYAEQAKILLIALAIDDEDLIVVDTYHGEKIPSRYQQALLDPSVRLGVFNASFEYEIIKAQQAKGKWRKIPIEANRWYDVAVQANEHGCGAAGSEEEGSVSLALLCDLLGAPQDMMKDKTGKNLIQMFSVPSSRLFIADPDPDLDEWQLFKDYCAQDVVAARWCSKRLPAFNYPGVGDKPCFEWELAFVDQQMNRRGIPINYKFARLAEEISRAATDAANVHVANLTQCRVTSINQTAAIKDYLNQRGYPVDDVQAPTLEKLDIRPSDVDVAELVELRLDSGAAQAKYAKMLDLAWWGYEGLPEPVAVPYSLIFCGASRTRRWSGRGFQPHNLKRPKLKDAEINALRRLILSGVNVSDRKSLLSDMGDLVRSAIEAPKGQSLVVADLSAIENRVLMWLADDKNEVGHFRAVDSGEAQYDAYVMTYSRAFGLPPDQVDSGKRMIGKVMALLLQYWGGVGGLMTGVRNWRLNVNDLARIAYDNCTEADVERSKRNYEYMKGDSVGSQIADTLSNDFLELEEAIGGQITKKKPDRTCGLNEWQFVGLDIIKCKWRDSHREVGDLGKAIEESFKMSLESPGKTIQLPAHFQGRLAFVTQGDFTFLRLPTRGLLTYFKAKYDKDGITVLSAKHRKIVREPYYAGKFLENVASGTSRDILARGLMRIWHDKKAQLHPFLTVHDEVVCTCPADGKEEKRLAQMIGHLTAPVEGLEGLPLNAKGWYGKYYRKD